MDLNLYHHADEATKAWQHRVESGFLRMATTLMKILSQQEKIMTAQDDVVAQVGNLENVMTGLAADLKAFEDEGSALFTALQNALNANNMNGLADVATRLGVLVTGASNMRSGLQAAIAADDPAKAAPPVVTPPPVEPPVTPPADPGTTPAP